MNDGQCDVEMSFEDVVKIGLSNPKKKAIRSGCCCCRPWFIVQDAHFTKVILAFEDGKRFGPPMNIDLSLYDEEHLFPVVTFPDDDFTLRVNHLFGDPGQVAEFFRRHSRKQGDVLEEQYFLNGYHIQLIRLSGHRLQDGLCHVAHDFRIVFNQFSRLFYPLVGCQVLKRVQGGFPDHGMNVSEVLGQLVR